MKLRLFNNSMLVVAALACIETYGVQINSSNSVLTQASSEIDTHTNANTDADAEGFMSTLGSALGGLTGGGGMGQGGMGMGGMPV